MTQHPDELLAAYVDGDIDVAERRAVQSHLRECERCRDEVEMATRARDALASLPEVEPPPGTSFRILREARRAPATGRAWRVATAVGVAASLAAGVVVLAQRVDLGGRDATATSARPQEAGREAPPAPDGAAAPENVTAGGDLAGYGLPRFRTTASRYEFDDMPRVATRIRRQAETLLGGVDAADRPQSLSSTELATPPRARRALECATSAIRETAGVEDPGVPFSLEAASFLDDDAGEYVPGYVAAYLRESGSEGRFDSLFLTVVDARTCARLLYLAPDVRI